MPRCRFAFVLPLALCVSTAAFGATLNLGFISYDVLIPGDAERPGVNVFNSANYTGDPLAGGFALPPDFPVYTALTFLGSSLTLLDSGPATVVTLGNLGPGPNTPPPSLQFPDTSSFSSALFSATLSHTSFLLSDGLTFVADSSLITATIVPSTGPSLTPGSDFAIVAVEGQIVPEPGSVLLTAAALVGLAIRARFRPRS